MAGFFRKITILILAVAAAYAAVFCFRLLKPGKAVVVEDMRSGSVARVLTGKYCFAYEGAMPWWFSLREIPLEREFSGTARIGIPGLSALDDGRYDIRIPVRFRYLADPDIASAQAVIMRGEAGMDQEVFSRIQSLMRRELVPYIDPAYKRDQLNYNRDRLAADIGKKIRQEMKRGGLDVSSFAFEGGMYLPAAAEYYEALKHLDEMGRIKRKNDVEAVILVKKLDREKMSNEEYYKKLIRISDIIKNNPDILKYIYIDKLADNMKVVSSVDSFDVLGDSSAKKNNVSPSRKGDIDNLR